MVPLEGPVSVGALFDAIMFGCLIVQSCVYYKNSRGDTWLLKVLVLLILSLLLSHLSCTAAWLWASTEVNNGDTIFPDYASVLLGLSSVCGAVILFLERCFFSHRILKSSNNHLLAFTLFVFCIFSFTAALGAATVFFSDAIAVLTSQLSSNWVFSLVIISGLTCDLAISLETALYLRSQSPTDAADALGCVSRLVFVVAETGAVMSLYGVATVIAYWLTKTSLAWVGLLVVMPGVFANTFLAALNARGQLCADIQHERVKFGEKLIDDRVGKPPVLIAITKKMDKRSEKSPV